MPGVRLTTLAHLLQLVVNGVMTGTILRTPAIGLTLIYAVLRFPNFAIAGHATVGAFAGYVANTALGWPLIPALAVAFGVAGVIGTLTDQFVLKPFRPAGSINTAIASVALTIALENIVRFGSGNELRGYDLPIMRLQFAVSARNCSRSRSCHRRGRGRRALYVFWC